jgi:tetratricopeptide (TPR) repeat protein
MAGILAKVVAPIVARGGYDGAFIGVPLTAVCGLVLAIIWRHAIAGVIAKPFTSIYDGGNEPAEPHPYYSVAQARIKRGRYAEAVVEIHRQLARFPTDPEGHLLLAQVQAENLKDLPAAEQTIQTFCAQPGHAPKNIAFALYSMADWHLQVGRDPEGARRALERITELLPDTEFALGAAQRIAHLASPEMLQAPFDRKKFKLVEAPKNLGLQPRRKPFAPRETEPESLAAEYVKHLGEHPFDTEAREKLATLYVEHYGRLDLATDQLEQLIGFPGQPARQVVRWLNQMADLQVRSGADYETVRHTLQRIIDLDPALASAELARNRLALLKLELKGKEKGQAVKLGTYEQNLGLKQGGPPPRHDR